MDKKKHHKIYNKLKKHFTLEQMFAVHEIVNPCTKPASS